MNPEQNEFFSNMLKINDRFCYNNTKKFLLGQGRFGKVYKGLDRQEKKIISVKYIQKQKVKGYGYNFDRQIKMMKDLSQVSHPNLMGYYGFQVHTQGVFMFLQYCSGGKLSTLCSEGISQLKVMELMRQIFNAMAFLNQRNILHRDLKPDNILLDENNNIKIGDFGTVRQINAFMTQKVGTPIYSSPQIMKISNVSDHYCFKSDVWSAGLILYQMLTGQEYFKQVQTRVKLEQQINLLRDPSKIKKYPSDLHPEWQNMTQQMLIYDKQQRPSFSTLKRKFCLIYQKMQGEIEAKLDTHAIMSSQVFSTGSIMKSKQTSHLINDLRKYLLFSHNKNTMYTKLIKSFTKNQYNRTANVFKYMLMFFSTAVFVCKQQTIIKQIEDQLFIIDNKIITRQCIPQANLDQFEEIIQYFKKEMQNSFEQYKNVLQNQVINRLLDVYMDRAQQKEIIKGCGDALKLLQNAKQGIYGNFKTYLQHYCKVIRYKSVSANEEELLKWPQSDVRSYTQTLIIAHLDKIIPDQKFRNDDIINLTKQRIQRKNKEKLLEYIRAFNVVS